MRGKNWSRYVLLYVKRWNVSTLKKIDYCFSFQLRLSSSAQVWCSAASCDAKTFKYKTSWYQYHSQLKDCNGCNVHWGEARAFLISSFQPTSGQIVIIMMNKLSARRRRKKMNDILTSSQTGWPGIFWQQIFIKIVLSIFKENILMKHY